MNQQQFPVTAYDVNLPRRLREVGGRYIVVHPVPGFVLRMIKAGKIKPRHERIAKKQANKTFTQAITYAAQPEKLVHGRGAEKRTIRWRKKNLPRLRP